MPITYNAMRALRKSWVGRNAVRMAYDIREALNGRSPLFTPIMKNSARIRMMSELRRAAAMRAAGDIEGARALEQNLRYRLGDVSWGKVALGGAFVAGGVDALHRLSSRSNNDVTMI